MKQNYLLKVLFIKLIDFPVAISLVESLSHLKCFGPKETDPSKFLSLHRG